MIGVNNRNLRTFVTRLEHTLDMAARLPARVLPGERERHPHARRHGALGGKPASRRC